MLITREELALHPVRVERTFEPGVLDYQSSDFRQIEALDIKAVADLVGEEIHVHGRLGTRLESECDRCAVRFDFPVECDFDLFYRPVSSIAREEEIEISSDELVVGFYQGDGVDLTDIIREQVLLALPMKMLCGPECRGLCPTCGTNRNLAGCQCEDVRVDSPFADLMPRPDSKR
ncbi:MAG: YceD family protein [Terriglobia bacterium]